MRCSLGYFGKPLLFISVVLRRARPSMEKRRCLRFLALDKAFAVVRSRVRRIDEIRVGWMKNITRNGLALEYPSHADWGRAPSYVDVLSPRNRFHLSRVPCRLVYDIRVPGAYVHSFLHHHTQRSNVAWNLKDSQTTR